MDRFIYFGDRLEMILAEKDGSERELVFRKLMDRKSSMQRYDGKGRWTDVEGLWTDYFFHRNAGQHLYVIEKKEARKLMKNRDRLQAI